MCTVEGSMRLVACSRSSQNSNSRLFSLELIKLMYRRRMRSRTMMM